MRKLTNDSCSVCVDSAEPLSSEQVTKLLDELDPKWSLSRENHLIRKFKFSNFIKAMNMANKIADLAEKEKHHPNMYVGWGFCDVEIWTHKIENLTENDFILAAKIDNLVDSL